MDVFPKFIIETNDELVDCLILSKCTYHKQLATNLDKVKGGGWFRFSAADNAFIFYGSSDKFGEAKFEDIKKCVEECNVYTNIRCTRSISTKYKFLYDTQSELIPLN